MLHRSCLLAGLCLAAACPEPTLEPIRMHGFVLDAATRTPIADVLVLSEGHETRTDAAGQFSLPLTASAKVHALVPGHRAARSITPWPVPHQLVLAKFQVRAGYLKLWKLRRSPREMFDRIKASSLNAIVIDVDTGEVRRGAVAKGLQEYVRANNLAGIIAEARKRDLYIIARIQLFKPAKNTAPEPDWAVKTPDGAIFVDESGNRWLDPENPEVRAYITAFAGGVAALGVDEVQLDFIRFSHSKKPFRAPPPGEERFVVIERVVEEVRTAVHRHGVFLSIDVFGITALTPSATIGQRLETIGPLADYVSPMFYPSLFSNGMRGMPPVPADDPYGTVRAALERAVAKISKNRVNLRPWLQGKVLSTAAPVQSAGDYVGAEIKAVRDVASDRVSGWMLWSSSGDHDWEALARMNDPK